MPFTSPPVISSNTSHVTFPLSVKRKVCQARLASAASDGAGTPRHRCVQVSTSPLPSFADSE